MKKIKPLFTIGVFILLFFSCEKNDKIDEPEIVGCNSIKYKGKTVTTIGCDFATSFDLEFMVNYETVVLHVTCSAGCISSATVK